MIRLLTAVAMIALTSPVSSQQMYMCCQPNFSITRGEAEIWEADEAKRNADNAAEWARDHAGRIYTQCDNFGKGPVNCITVAPLGAVVTMPTFQRTFEPR